MKAFLKIELTEGVYNYGSLYETKAERKVKSSIIFSIFWKKK